MVADVDDIWTELNNALGQSMRELQPTLKLTKGAAALLALLCTAALLSGCTSSMPTALPCPDASLDLYEVRRAEASPPLVADISGSDIPEPSCSFTWVQGESQQVTEALWVLEDSSAVPILFEKLTSALVASEWELYMEQSDTHWMLLPVGAEPASPRLNVMALTTRQLADYALYSNENAIVATLTED